jgi:hypothetical protein
MHGSSFVPFRLPKPTVVFQAVQKDYRRGNFFLALLSVSLPVLNMFAVSTILSTPGHSNTLGQSGLCDGVSRDP